jgi:hypothetical protein
VDSTSQPQSSKGQPTPNGGSVYLLLDTNVWLEHLLLRTPLGASVLYALSRLNARLLLPEVVEKELDKHVKERAWEAVEAMERTAETLRRVTGKPVPFETADYEGLENAAAIRLKELGTVIERAEMKLEHARAALELVNNDLPPNGPKNQQFKDSLIWQVAKEFSRESKVFFVTKDKGFFAGRQPSQGLADNLVAEVTLKELDIQVSNSLEAVLDSLEQKAPPFDPTPVIEEVEKTVSPLVEHEGRQQGLQLLDRASADIAAFPTEQADQVTLTYRFRYRLVDTGAGNESESKRDPTITAFGEVSYNMKEGTIQDLQPDRFEFEWLTAMGERGQSTIYYAQAFLGINPAQYL